jgi:hypothetical protein
MRLRRSLLPILAVATLASASARAQGTLTGTVFDSLRSFGPLREVSVLVMELNRVVTTDARGRFRFDSLPSGTYRVTFFHPLLDSIGIGAGAATVTVADGAASETFLSTPSSPALYRRLCGPAREQSLGAIVGHVRDVDTRNPIASATVETFWGEFQRQQGAFKRHTYQATTTSGAEGAYILCAVPSDVPLDVTARASGFEAGPVTVVHGREVVALRDIEISRRDSAARADTPGLVRDSTRIARGAGTIRGTVLDAAGRVIAGAPVRVVADSRETRSDAAGAFVLSSVPAGTRTLEARAIGYEPTTVAVNVPSTGFATAAIRFDRRPQQMRAITVVGQKPKLDLQGFSERMHMGVGQFITDEDLVKRPVARIGDALLRSANLTYDLTSVGPELKMRASGTIANDTRCVPNFYVDGMLVPPAAEGTRQTMLQTIETMVYPNDVRGIEVYSSLGEIPAQYNRNNGCGAIVVWLK